MGFGQGRFVHYVGILRIASGVVGTKAIVILSRRAEVGIRVGRDIRAYGRNLCKGLAITRPFDLKPCLIVRLIVPGQVDLAG